MKTLIDKPFLFALVVLGIAVITTVVLTAIVAAWLLYSLITGIFAAIAGSIVLIAFVVSECLIFKSAMKSSL